MGKRDFRIRERRLIFAEKLTQALSEKGITQTTFAEMMGTTQQTISRWCKGACEPDYDALLLICGYLDETPNDLFEFDEKDVKMYANAVIRDIAANSKEFRKEQREISNMLLENKINEGEFHKRDNENLKKYIEFYNKKFHFNE